MCVISFHQILQVPSFAAGSAFCPLLNPYFMEILLFFSNTQISCYPNWFIYWVQIASNQIGICQRMQEYCFFPSWLLQNFSSAVQFREFGEHGRGVLGSCCPHHPFCFLFNAQIPRLQSWTSVPFSSIPIIILLRFCLCFYFLKGHVIIVFPSFYLYHFVLLSHF